MAHRPSSSCYSCRSHYLSPRGINGYRETLPLRPAGARQTFDSVELSPSFGWFVDSLLSENSILSRLRCCHGRFRIVFQCHSEKLCHSAREPRSSGSCLYRNHSRYLRRDVGQWAVACTGLSLGHEGWGTLDWPAILGRIRAFLDMSGCCFGD
jgi:hypothetical protein